LKGCMFCKGKKTAVFDKTLLSQDKPQKPNLRYQQKAFHASFFR